MKQDDADDAEEAEQPAVEAKETSEIISIKVGPEGAEVEIDEPTGNEMLVLVVVLLAALAAGGMWLKWRKP